MREKLTKLNITLMIGSVLFSLLAVEVIIRLLISPSPYSYGNFMGHELPPLKIFPEAPGADQWDRSAWYDSLIVDNKKITIGDLWGFFRNDNLIGYVPREKMISENRWWQSNNLGARKRAETFKDKPKDRRRILVFGDSFTNCSRVPQEETWPYILESESENLEVVNFGVDGYSTGQVFLWFQRIREKVDYDLVIVLFVPAVDLWRDINVRRDLGEGGWYTNTLMPRYILDQGELQLIRFPLDAVNTTETSLSAMTNQVIKNHIKKYDEFYFESRFEMPWFLGESAIYKLIAASFHKYKRNHIRKSLLTGESEAASISKEIFLSMHDRIKRDGGKFILAFLPVWQEFDKLAKDTTYRNNWKKLITSICDNRMNCIDLSEDLVNIPKDLLDKGYDGTHFGPKTNQHIAGFIKAHLDRLNDL